MPTTRKTSQQSWRGLTDSRTPMAVRKVLADNDRKQYAWSRTVLGLSITKGVADRALDTKSTWQYPHANAPGCTTEGVGLQTWALSPVPHKQQWRLCAHIHFRCVTEGNIDRKLRGANQARTTLRALEVVKVRTVLDTGSRRRNGCSCVAGSLGSRTWCGRRSRSSRRRCRLRCRRGSWRTS